MDHDTFSKYPPPDKVPKDPKLKNSVIVCHLGRKRVRARGTERTRRYGCPPSPTLVLIGRGDVYDSDDDHSGTNGSNGVDDKYVVIVGYTEAIYWN